MRKTSCLGCLTLFIALLVTQGMAAPAVDELELMALERIRLHKRPVIVHVPIFGSPEQFAAYQAAASSSSKIKFPVFVTT